MTLVRSFGAGGIEPEKGPVAAGTPPCAWGAVARDPVNDEFVWFGGTGGRSKTGGLRTWILKGGAWTEAEFGTPEGRALHAKALTLEDAARDLYAAVANRFYLSESAAEAKADLTARANVLLKDVMALEVPSGDAFATDRRAAATKALETLAPRLARAPTVKEVADARSAWMACVRLAWALDAQPALRCNPSMVYDAATKTIVLFGGEGIHGAYNDTWLYDCATRAWRRSKAPVAPSPRMTSGLVAKGGVVYLVGGYAPRDSMSYFGDIWQRLPFDIWRYDIQADRWTLIKAPEGEGVGARWQPPVQAALSDDGRSITWAVKVIAWGQVKSTIDGSAPLADADAGTAKFAQPSDTIRVRGLSFDPAWFEAVPPPDPKAVDAKLATLPANRWVNMEPPKTHFNRDWGTTVLDPQRDQLLHWGGGHSAYCGTDVIHYSLATNRWHKLYTPEMPFEYCYSNSGAPVPSMTGRPWAPHTYLSYAVDALTDRMIWTGKHGAYGVTNPGGTFLYEPGRYAWSWPPWTIEGGRFDVERHKTCLVPTPHGVAVWADKRGGTGGQSGLWLADVATHTYQPLAATDYEDRTTLPPTAYGDRHGITYDSKRDRVLLFHFGIQDKHKVWAVDLKTKQVTVLEPKGAAAFPADVSLGREATYLTDDDLVIVCTRKGKDDQATLVYDCAANAWLELAGAFTKDDKGRAVPAYGVSTGIEWDPKRRLLWLVQTRGEVYVMRIDRKAADLKALDGE